MKKLDSFSLSNILLLISVSMFLAPACSHTKVSPRPSNKKNVQKAENEVEVITISPLIVLRGQVNGNPANVLFDTGTWPNLIGTHVKSKISCPIDLVGPSDGRYQVCDWRNLKLGKFESTNSGRICLIDLASIDERISVDIDAVAGTPFSIGRVFEINFEKRMFLVHDDHIGSYEFTTDIELDEHGSPCIELEIGEAKGKFLIDTGYNGLISVNQKLADTLKRSGAAREHGGEVTRQIYADGFETYNSELLTIDTQNMFGYDFTNIPISVSKDLVSGNRIGLELLRSFNVSLDLKNGKLRLNKNSIYSLSNGCTISCN